MLFHSFRLKDYAGTSSFFFIVMRFTALGSQIFVRKHRAVNSKLTMYQSSSLYSSNIWIYNKVILFLKNVS